MTEQDQKRFEYFNKIQKANYGGYAGCLSNGNLVDRRENPEGYPVAENKMFGINKPRCIQCENETHISLLQNSLCPDCRNHNLKH